MNISFIKKNSGFSLIEMVVSISILVIMATAFVTLLSRSYSYIFISGLKSDALFQAQKEIEPQLAEGTTLATDTLEIDYDVSVGVAPLTIQGTIITETKIYNGTNSVVITSFIPKR